MSLEEPKDLWVVSKSDSGVLVGTSNTVATVASQTENTATRRAAKLTQITSQMVGVTAPPKEVLLPPHVKGTRQVEVPEAAQVLELTQRTRIKPDAKKQRTSTDYLRFVHDPPAFIAQHVRSRLTRISPLHQEVLVHLEHLRDEATAGDVYSTEAVKRQTSIQRYFDKATRETKTYTVSSAGELEEVCVSALELLQEKELMDAGRTITDTISLLMKRYRIELDDMAVLPEMPDATKMLNDLIEAYKPFTRARFGLYEILQQITLPESLAEEILWRMDRVGDLDHPLAFALTRQLADKKPDSVWLKECQTRREALLQKLTGSAQEVFDAFPDLFSQSLGLIYHGDPLAVETGKIGLEIELDLQEDIIGKKNPNELPFWRRMKKDFTLGTDIGTKEIRKADDRLTHDGEYLQSLIELARWAREYAKQVKSIHLHLDRDQHPYRPGVGEFFGQENEAVKENEHGTWEIRGLNLPKGLADFHPGRIEDLMGTYISAASIPNRRPTTDKIHITSAEDTTLERLIYGHFASYFAEPQARLAVLMALHDDISLRNLNPLTLLHTIDDDSLLRVLPLLKKRLTSDFDQTMLGYLQGFASSENPRAIWAVIDSDDQIEVLHVLGGDLDDIYRFRGVFAAGIKSNEYMVNGEAASHLVLVPGEAEKLLQSDDEDIRMGAVVGLKRDPQAHRDVLIELYRTHTDNDVKKIAARALAQDPSLNHDLILEMLDGDTDASTAYEVIMELGIRHRNNQSLLWEIFRTNNSDIIKAGAAEMLLEDDELLVKYGRQWFQSGEVEMKHAVIVAAQKKFRQYHDLFEQAVYSLDISLNSSALSPFLDDVGEHREFLESVYRSHPQRHIRELIIRHFATQRSEEFEPLLRLATHDQDGSVRTVVYKKFAADPDKYRDLLVNGMHDLSYEVRRIAFNGLVQDPERNRDVIEATLSTETGHIFITAVRTLAKMGADNRGQLLEFYRGERDGHKRKIVLENIAFELWSTPELLPDIVKDPDAQVRLLVANYLTIDPQRYRSYLEMYLQDADVLVRKRAVSILGRMEY